jgi:hypothetical protein
MRDKVEIKSKSLLVVEGQDETNFFIALLKKMNIEGVQLLDIGGKDRFRPEMKSLAFAKISAQWKGLALSEMPSRNQPGMLFYLSQVF